MQVLLDLRLGDDVTVSGLFDLCRHVVSFG